MPLDQRRQSQAREVSRALWQKLYQDKSVVDVPITHVTNGVHVPTWTSPLLRWVFEKYMGQEWEAKLLDQNAWTDAVAKISDDDLWFVHSRLKEKLIALFNIVRRKRR